MRVGGYILGGTVQGRWDVIFHIQKHQSNEHNSDMRSSVASTSDENTVCLSLVRQSLPQHFAQSCPLNTYFMDRFISELSFFLSRSLSGFFLLPCLLLFLLFLLLILFLLSHTTVPRSNGASLHYVFPHSSFHK